MTEALTEYAQIDLGQRIVRQNFETLPDTHRMQLAPNADDRLRAQQTACVQPPIDSLCLVHLHSDGLAIDAS